MNFHQNSAKETLYSGLSSLSAAAVFFNLYDKPDWEPYTNEGLVSDKTVVATLTHTKCGSFLFT